MFGPSTYWECFLDKMPGVKNDPAAVEIIKQCSHDFPEAQYSKSSFLTKSFKREE